MKNALLTLSGAATFAVVAFLGLSRPAEASSSSGGGAYPYCTRGTSTLCCSKPESAKELATACALAGGDAVACVFREAARFGCVTR
jgi:hypothetical protein